jgi:hypothetical protein
MQGLRFALASAGQNGQPDFKPGQRHYPAGNTSDIIAYGVWGDANQRNCYFAVGGFSGATLNEFNKPRRVATDAAWHRCLRLDIDVGPGKDYTDRRVALSQLLAMVQHYTMPKPWIIDSGGGFHIYWSFDRDVTLVEWMPMAGRLRAACEQFGLMVDLTTTTDAARVLRLPGTHNNKLAFVAAGNCPEVRILQVGDSIAPEQVVLTLPQADVSFTNAAVPAGLRGMQSELQANMHEPYFLRDLLKQCPGMLAMVTTGGAHAVEPLWKKALDLINKSDDTDDLKLRVARGVSVGHAGFSEQAFQAKWQLTKHQNYHPPRCVQMAGAGMPECATCPHRGKISSPLVLGRFVAPAHSSSAVLQPAPQPADPPADAPATPPASATLSPAAAAPAPLQVGVFLIGQSTTVQVVDGRITARLLIADGYPTQVVESEPDAQGVKKMYNRHMLDYRLRAVERMLDNVGDRSMVVLTFERGLDGTVQVEFDNRDFAEPKSFYNKLMSKGLYCSRRNAVDFVDKFMTEFLTSLQRARAASQIAGRCGWSDDLKSFVLGTQVYRNDGSFEHIRTSGATEEMEGYHTAGDAAAWRRAFDICLSGGVDRQCVLALAIAGPLMVFTGLDGVLMNAYSPESGVGKSTLCDAALSIWGAPDVLRKDFRDTANATFKLAAVTGNMPMVIDEFTNVEGRALSDYVYTITQGREKHRLTSDAKLSAGGSTRWCLAAIATANNSIHEKLQQYRPDSTAEAARVFEMRLFPLVIDPAKMGEIKSSLMALRHSYGFLGPQLVRLFLSKDAAYWRQAVMTRIAKWDREASQSAGDRFRSACCALIEIGAALGAGMGYAFDTKGVEQQLRKHWTKQVADFEADRKKPMDFLNGYVLQHMGEFVMRGGPDGLAVLGNNNLPRRIMGEIKGKTLEQKWTGSTVLIPIQLLREFVRDQNGNFKAVMEWLESGNPAVVRHGRLDYMSGTNNALSTHCVEMLYTDLMGTAKPALTVVQNTSQPEQSHGNV